MPHAYTTAAFGRRIGIYVGVTHAITASIAWGCCRLDAVASGLPRVTTCRATVQCEDAGRFSAFYRRVVGHQPLLGTGRSRGQRNVNGRQGIRASAFIVGGLRIITTQHVNNYATASVYSATPYCCLASPKFGRRARPRVAYGAGLRLSRCTHSPVSNRSRTPPKKWTRRPEPAESHTDRDLPSAGATHLLTLTVAMLLGSNKIAASDDTVNWPRPSETLPVSSSSEP